MERRNLTSAKVKTFEILHGRSVILVRFTKNNNPPSSRINRDNSTKRCSYVVTIEGYYFAVIIEGP